MAYILLPILIAIISFSEIKAELIEELSNAIINDLNTTCVQETEVNTQTIKHRVTKCIQDEYDQLQMQAADVKDLWINLICHDEVVQRCNKQINNFASPCLSDESLEVLNQVVQVKEAAVESLCADDGKNLRAIMEKQVDCGSGPVCEMAFSTGTIYLKNFFSSERCEKYKDFIKCRTEGSCADLNNLYDITYKAMFQASPCSN